MHRFHLPLVDDHENIRFTFCPAPGSDGCDVDTAASDARFLRPPGDAGRGIFDDLDPRTVRVPVKPLDRLPMRPERRHDRAINGSKAFTDSTRSHPFTGGVDGIVTF